MSNLSFTIAKRIVIASLTFFLTFIFGLGIGIGSLVFLNSHRDFSFSEAWVKITGKETLAPSPEPPLDSSNIPFISSGSASVRTQVATASATFSPGAVNQRIIVLNATEVSGRASAMEKKLRQQNINMISIGNTKASYEPGNYIFLPSESQLSQAEIESILDIRFTTMADIPQLEEMSEKDIVIVIGE